MRKAFGKHLTLRTGSVMAALASCFLMASCNLGEQRTAGPPEKVTVAIAAIPDTALAQIAGERGFFREAGLDAVIRRQQYGKLALREILEGKADFATVAETPVMFAIMDGAKISIVATIMTSNSGHAILARRDRGIAVVEDLKGKRIGATRGTTSEFFLQSFLISRKISPKETKVVNLMAADIPDALARGDIDAASTFAPFTLLAHKKLGDKGVVFRDRDIYRDYFNVVATQDLIRTNPGKVKKMLRALLRAEDFTREHPAEARKIMADFSGMQPDTVRDFCADASFAVTLDQTLVLSLEDESDWAIKYRLTGAKKVPNYLDHIYIDALRAVKPDAVRIMR